MTTGTLDGWSWSIIVAGLFMWLILKWSKK